MSRVDELQKKYPSLPREFIIKWDAMSQGVQDSEVLDKTGFWMRSLVAYTRDHFKSLTEMVKDRPQRIRPGWIRLPSAFFMRNGIGAGVQRDQRSPYDVRETGDDQYALFEGEEKVEDVWFPGAAVGEPGDKDFWPGSMMSGANRNCGLTGGSANAPVHETLPHCAYFTTGDQCKFCNFNANHDASLVVGLRPPKAGLDQVIENYRIRASRVKINEVGVGVEGALPDPEQQAKRFEYYIDVINRAASVTPSSYHTQFMLYTRPLSRKQVQRAKDAGVTVTRTEMEVWDKQLFAEVCPGKAKHFGHEGYLEYLENAADIFGEGQTGAQFVSGVTLMSDNGHRTWQEARDSELEGFRWLIKRGIVPTFTPFRPAPGSVYGDDKSTPGKMPPTELYLEVGLGHHKAMLEYGLYEKMNKFVACPFCCMTILYEGELGMIELAGNPGNWLADTIPHEANWLAQFVESIESTGRFPTRSRVDEIVEVPKRSSTTR